MLNFPLQRDITKLKKINNWQKTTQLTTCEMYKADKHGISSLPFQNTREPLKNVINCYFKTFYILHNLLLNLFLLIEEKKTVGTINSFFFFFFLSFCLPFLHLNLFFFSTFQKKKKEKENVTNSRKNFFEIFPQFPLSALNTCFHEETWDGFNNQVSKWKIE